MNIPNWANKVILIVEDDDISLEFLKEFLIPSRAKLLLSDDGLEAIKIIKRNPQIDLILMDIQLPVMSGRDAIVEIKKIRKDIPVIAQTAFAMSGDKDLYLNLGFDDYISKPINLNELLDKIRTIFGQS